MDIRFYLTLLLRRLHYVILFTLLGSAIGVTLALILPPRYVAEARLVVESQQIPDELAASTVTTEAIEQLQIIRQRILARDTLLDMADRFDIYATQEGEALSPDEIVSDMRARITINTTGGTQRGQASATLVDVRFSAERAALSAAVANEVVTLILQENVEMRTSVSGQTLDFFEQEVQRLDRELAERSAQVSLFQEENRDALPESLEFRRNQLITLQERRIEIDRELEQLRDRRQSLEALYAQTGGIGMEPEDQMSPEARELQQLRQRYASSAAVMSDQNPRMRILRQQIESLEAVVSGQNAEGEANEAGAGEAAQALSPYELQIADIENQIEFLQERRAQIETQMEELSRTIAATPNNAITLSGLQRDLENTRAQYDRAVANRASAQTGDTIEALSKGQRISVIENAVAPGEPNSPDRRKVALAGFGGGLMAGLGLVLLLELLNTSVRRASEIEEALQITPIGTLSYMRTQGEIRRRRALIALAFVVAAAGIPAALWAIDTYYMPIDLLVAQIVDRLPVLGAL